jgi:hypothetical protein
MRVSRRANEPGEFLSSDRSYRPTEMDPTNRSSEQRSRLRIALLVNKIYHLNLPVQLADILSLLNAASTGHNLRSTACGLFNITRTRMKMGDRTFASAATKIWNELPLDIRESVRQSVFKDKVVKHYLL